MTTNDIHPINNYLPMNAETLEQVTQYYNVRTSEWFLTEAYDIKQIHNGVFVAKIKSYYERYGISIYIPHSLRGRGLLKDTLRMYKDTVIYTMSDCHVLPLLEKYHDYVYEDSALSDFLIYRDLRYILCQHTGFLKSYFLWEINDYLLSCGYYELMLYECYRMLEYAYKDDIISIKNMIYKSR